MLEGLSHIPIELDDFNYPDSSIIIDAANKMRKYIPKSARGRSIHDRSDTASYIMQLAHYMDSIKCVDTKYAAYSRYYRNDSHRFVEWANGASAHNDMIGIFINEEAKTHYVESTFVNIKRMPMIENCLKQSPSHFLRIFTSAYNSALYVWTNKPLSPVTIYKLKQLQHTKIDPFECSEQYITDFYNALVENNLEKFIKAVNAFFESDLVKDNEYRMFAECVNYNTTRRIQIIEEDLKNYRANIIEYEKRIADLSVQIRDGSDTLMMLRNKDQKEDIKTLYKYLCKHPYIYRFEALDNGVLVLDYAAPLIYFNEYAIEKIQRHHTSAFERGVLNLFLSRKFELYTACKLNFSTNNFRVGIDATTNTNYFPHPHIDRYHCFGNHQAGISDSAISGDYLGAIEQITQAVLNINFYDGCVVNRMLIDLENTYPDRETWLDKNTGELITTAEAIRRNTNETTQTND